MATGWFSFFKSHFYYNKIYLIFNLLCKAILFLCTIFMYIFCKYFNPILINKICVAILNITIPFYYNEAFDGHWKFTCNAISILFPCEQWLGIYFINTTRHLNILLQLRLLEIYHIFYHCVMPFYSLALTPSVMPFYSLIGNTNGFYYNWIYWKFNKYNYHA